MVGVAELPVENTFVLTGGLGIIGFTSGSKFFLGRQRHLGRLLLGHGRFLLHQFLRHAHGFGPWCDRFRDLWRR